jgi:hypothetical protein
MRYFLTAALLAAVAATVTTSAVAKFSNKGQSLTTRAFAAKQLPEGSGTRSLTAHGMSR